MNGKRVLIEIECEDLEDYFSKQEFSGFLESIKTNTKRYQKLFTDAADEIQLIRTDAQAEVESFDEVLDNFRLSNLERKDGAKPPKEFLNALKRKL
jgi:O-methyltransferase involved in polyketide biosynthesis